MIYSLKRGEPKKGWVLIVHGLGEHIGRYDKLIDMLVKEGFGVIGFDLPGHGKSSGKRGNTTIEDAVAIIDELTKSVNRFTVFGHSLGGLIAIRYTELRPQKVNNLVVSSPALNIEMKSSQKAMMSIFSVLAPSLTVNNGINPNLLSRNKSAIEKYVSDSLVHDRISVRLAKSMMKNIELAHEQAERIVCPVSILIGTDDKVTLPDGARKFFDELKTENKTLREFQGGYHELFEDPEHAESFYESIIHYIKQYNE